MTISPEEAQEIANKMPETLPVYQDESGQIFIPELKPMSEAPKDCKIILVLVAGDHTLCQAHHRSSIERWQVSNYEPLKTNNIIGWTKMPIYQPNIPKG